ncbi:plasma membrane calcium [Lecanora helva]
MTDVEKDGKTTPPPPQSTRRQRAPTITINTSPGDQSEELDHEPAPLLSESPHPDLRAAHSFESNRPTSPHNISSPASKWADNRSHNFLAVPNTRSRGNSVDSDEPGHSPTTYSGETSVSSLASTAEGRSSTLVSNDSIINDRDALRPDNEEAKAEFEVEQNKFAFSPGQLSKMLNPKSLAAFYALGGLRGLEKGLRTDCAAGLSLDEMQLDGTVSFSQAVAFGRRKDFEDPPERLITRATTTGTRKITEDSFADRKRIYKANRLPEKKAKSFLQLAWMAYNDKVLILLSVAAVVSLALGIYQSATPQPNGEAPVEWVEGVAIMVAIIIVTFVGAANDYQKERQFVKLNKKKDDRDVKVIRSGKSREISVHDVLVGDVMHLEPGDMIPADGIFISGHNLKCDESSATGESDLLKKYSGDEVYAAIDGHRNVSKMDPFIISGGKVSEGIGTFLVTAVGVNSSHGKIIMSFQDESQTTPLQMKLNILAEWIAKLGLGAGLLLFIGTFIRFLVQLNDITGGASAKGQRFLQVFIVAVTIVVVAVPEGLPLAVTLALAVATTRMLKDNNLVRLLRACETMGNATTICSDKTGTLTENQMSTVAGILGITAQFGGKKSPSSSATTSPDSPESPPDTPDVAVAGFVSSIADDVKDLLKQSIAVNSTAFEGEDEGGHPNFIGSKTETALLKFARDHLAMGSVTEERANATVIQFVPFDSGRKCMAAVVKLGEKRYRMYVKGASEILLDRCSQIIEDPTKRVSETNLIPRTMETLKGFIDTYASRSLRTLGLLYKDFNQWPPRGIPTQEDNNKLAVFDKVFKDMVFLGIVGIQDPLRVGVADAVLACQNAGVQVRMVTGDNLLTAKAIATECGIYTEGGMVLEGPVFRTLSDQEMNQLIPRLQVLARSSPDDKRILVDHLKALGETVAVTGDGTNDAPALKRADVGFSMGIAGTEVAKEASDIILMDDNFASIVKAIMWGRAVNDSVKKFLQFQITVNITAVILTFISGLASGTETSVLTAVQLLWVNLIMDTFAALALATDPPMPSILNRKPEPKSAPLITVPMWKMIIGQSIFQLVVTLTLYFAGASLLGYRTEFKTDQLQTLIFNSFVWMQIFNQYNSRRIDNKFNIFEGIQRNGFFIGIQVIIVAGQFLIVQFGGTAFSVHRLDLIQWAISLIIGLVSLPIAVLLRIIPDTWVRKCIPSRLTRDSTPALTVSDEELQLDWNPYEEIRAQLTFMKKLRGGRLNMLKYKLQHPAESLLPRSRSRSNSSRSRSRTNSPPQTPNNDQSDNASTQPPRTPDSRRSMQRKSPRSRSNSAYGPAAAMMATGIVAGSVAGWSPIGRRSEENSRFSHNGRSQLEEEEGAEIHPATSSHDPVITQNPESILGPPSQVPELAPTTAKRSASSLAPPQSAY